MQDGFVTEDDVEAGVGVPQLVEGGVLNNEFVVWDAEIVSLLTIVVILFLGDIGSKENIQFVVGEEAGGDKAGKATAATS